MKSLLSIGITLLFIGMSITPSTGFNTVEQSNTAIPNGKTLYVGGSGPNNYTRIQDAINDASDGDTVFVYNATYKEDLTINKSIILIGEDKINTIINGNAIVITNTENVVIGYFTIYYSEIYLNYSNNIKIFNIFFKFLHHGIIINKSERNEIYENTFYYCSVSICFNNSHQNIIHNNTIFDEEERSVLGIQLLNSNNNKILYNEISGNYGGHIPSASGIRIEESDFNYVAHNNIHNNNIGIYCKFSNQINIFKNNFSNNGEGVSLEVSDNNYIEQNIFSNYNFGVAIMSSYYCNITMNVFSDNNSLYILGSRSTLINQNNFFEINVLFSYFPFIHAIISPNNWNYNYWGKPMTHPKPIIGTMGIYIRIPWINFDWHPAKEPYNIEV